MNRICRLIGEKLRALRESRGWSQEELAEKSDLDPTYIGGIERGRRNPSLVSLAKLARALKISLPDLLRVPLDLGEEQKD